MTELIGCTILLPDDMWRLIFGNIDHNMLPCVRVDKNTCSIIESMLDIYVITEADIRDALYRGMFGSASIMIQRMINAGRFTISFADDLVRQCAGYVVKCKQRNHFAKMCISNSVSSKDVLDMIKDVIIYDNDNIENDDVPLLSHDMINWMIDLGYGVLLTSSILVVEFMITGCVWEGHNSDILLLRRLLSYRNHDIDTFIRGTISHWLSGDVLIRRLSVLMDVYRFNVGNIADYPLHSIHLLLYSITRVGNVPKRRRRKLPTIHEGFIDVPGLLRTNALAVRYAIAVEIRNIYSEQKIVFHSKMYNCSRVYIMINARVIKVYSD